MPMKFSANGDIVNAGTGATLSSFTALTLIAWIYRTGLNSGASAGIAQKGNFTNQDRRGLTLTFNTANPNLTVDRSTQDTNISSTKDVALNAWNFLACTFDTTNGGAMYLGSLLDPAVNVTSVNTAGSGATFSDASDPFTIGNTAIGGSAWFPGLIGAVSYWNVNLPLDAIHQQQKLFQPFSPSCRGAWILGSDGQSNVVDVSGNSNTGVVTGAVRTNDFLRTMPLMGHGRRRLVA